MMSYDLSFLYKYNVSEYFLHNYSFPKFTPILSFCQIICTINYYILKKIYPHQRLPICSKSYKIIVEIYVGRLCHFILIFQSNVRAKTRPKKILEVRIC